MNPNTYGYGGEVFEDSAPDADDLRDLSSCPFDWDDNIDPPLKGAA